MNKHIHMQVKRQKNSYIFYILLFLVLNLFSTSAFATVEGEKNIKSPLDIEQQQQKRVTIDMKNKSLLSIVKEISKKSGIGLMLVNDPLFNNIKNTSLTVTNVTARVALTKLLRGTGYTFSIVNNAINIFKAKTNVRKRLVSVSGTVINKTDKRPIVGATVIVLGTGSGAITDNKGTFIIRGVATGSEIEINYIGMKDILMIIDKTQLNLIIAMEEDAIAVKNVVVTGYEVIDRRMLTGSVATITADDMDRIGALTVDQMLEGKVAGLQITNISSAPGAASKVRIRSGGTFTGSRAPLWVVDGMIYEDPVPLSADDINSFDYVNLIGNAITGINPQDIESINILKDAAATAIYGTRASNGVIVITTKRGKVGKSSVSYTGSIAIQDRPHYSDFSLMNSKDRIDVSREIENRSMSFPKEIGTYVGYEYALREYKLGNVNYGQFQREVGKLETMNTDWFGALYRPAINNSHNVNISGGTDNARYYTSIGYNDDMGTEKGVSLNRITARSNLDIKLRDNVQVSVGISGSSQESKSNHSSVNLFDQAYYNSRAVPVYNDDNSLFYIDKEIARRDGVIYAGYNVLNEMAESGKTTINNDFNINAQLSWDITSGISLRAATSYRNTVNIHEEYITDKTFHIAEMRTYEEVEDKIDYLVQNNANAGPFGGMFSNGQTTSKSLMGRIQLNFDKSFAGKHFLNANIGYEANSSSHNGVSNADMPGYNHTQGKSFIKLPAFDISESGDLVNYQYANMLKWLTDSGSNSIYPSITDRVRNSLSMFGIFNYSYKNLYILNFNIRSDGSNQFGQYEKYKFKPTWSVSGRWNIHNESFFKGLENLDDLAIRGSYGFRGNPPSDLPYMIIKDFIENPRYGEHLASMVSFPNSNLTWEKTSTLNLGLNHSWFGGRLYGSADFAYSKSTDLLLSSPVSLVNGDPIQKYNGGSKQDYAYEFSLSGGIIKTKNFGFNLGFNFTYLKEEILNGYASNSEFDLNVNKYLDGGIYLTGFPIDAFYSYKFGGLDEKGHPTFLSVGDAPEDGSYLTYFENSLEYSGVRTPKYYGGFNAELRYKNLTFRASFSYKFGHTVRLLDMYSNTQNMPMPYENMHSAFNDRWREPGDEAFTSIPALSNSRLVASPDQGVDRILLWKSQMASKGATGWSMYDQSNARTVKGDHIRINNMTLSYAVPKGLIEKWNMNQIRASLQVSNVGVIVFDKDLKGQDPEQVQSVGMPALPTYTFSLSFSF